jgi:hypothetical protein
LAFELIGETRISYLMSWPHVRPWRMARTQPALRCIPDAQNVARINDSAIIQTHMRRQFLEPVRDRDRTWRGLFLSCK